MKVQQLVITLFIIIGCMYVREIVSEKLPPMPPAWPQQFTTIQTQYWPENGNAKQETEWFYDFTNIRSRFNHYTLINSPHDAFPTNSSEWWLGNELYMYDWDTFTCTKLDMGFGMPRPNWFISGSNVTGYEWLYRNDSYHKTVQVSKPSIPFYPNFNYYADYYSGIPFRLEAPGPVRLIVVNDFKNFNATTPDPELYNLPEEPVCVSGDINSLSHYHWSFLQYLHV